MRHLWQQALKHPFLRSSAVVTLFSFVASIFSYLMNLLIVKNFPVSTYGEYAAANSYIGLLSVPLLAFGNIIIRKIGSEKSADRLSVARSIESWIIGQLLRYWLGIGIVFGLFWYVSVVYGNMSSLSVLFVSFSLVSLVFTNLYGNIMQSLHRFGKYGWYLIVSTLTRFVIGLISVLMIRTLLGLYAAILSAVILVMLIGRTWVFGTLRLRLRATAFHPIFFYLRSARTVVPMITLVGLVGLSSVDVIVAKALLTPGAAGLYGTLSLLAKIILFVTTPVSTVAYVFFTDSDRSHKQSKLLLVSLVLVAAVGACTIVAYTLLPRLIIQVIATSAYLEIVPALWGGAMFGSLYSLVMVLGGYLISKNSSMGMISVAAVILQVVLLYLFHETFLEMMLVNAFACFLLLAIYGMVVFKSAR